MATFSKKMMGKEVGDASVYAKPHTMTGKVVKAETNPGKGRVGSVNMSVGPYSNKPEGTPTKTTGIVTRGNGAAIKGVTARGPMA